MFDVADVPATSFARSDAERPRRVAPLSLTLPRKGGGNLFAGASLTLNHVARMRISDSPAEHTLAVVPAKAGTHNHKRCLLHDAGTTSPAGNASHGVWVPAFAGTTRIMRRTRRDETVQLIPCDDLTLAAMHAGVVEARAGASLTLIHVARMLISDSPAEQHTRCRPAKAGTHNHKRCLLHDAGTTSPAGNASRGVWVPAFAGTTDDYAANAA